MKTAIAKAKMIRTTPRKLNAVLDQIRGLDVERAALQLTFSNKGVSSEIQKVLDSAIANAQNNFGMDIDNLYIKEVYSGKALKMKRFKPRARGRASRITKMFSNFTLILSEKRG